jgi:hypothetical protein
MQAHEGREHVPGEDDEDDNDPALHKAMLLLLSRAYNYALKTEGIFIYESRLRLNGGTVTYVTEAGQEMRPDLLHFVCYCHVADVLELTGNNRLLALECVIGIIEEGETWTLQLRQRSRPREGKVCEGVALALPWEVAHSE